MISVLSFCKLSAWCTVGARCRCSLNEYMNECSLPRALRQGFWAPGAQMLWAMATPVGAVPPRVFIPCSLFLASGRSCEHVLPFLFYFFYSFFFFNLTIVGLQRWASFSCITSDSFIVNCCKILTMVPCSKVSHSVMSDPMDCSLPSSSVHGILRARILEWVAISFSNGSLCYTVNP